MIRIIADLNGARYDGHGGAVDAHLEPCGTPVNKLDGPPAVITSFFNPNPRGKGPKVTMDMGVLLNPVGHQSTNWMDLLVITSIFFNPNPRGKRPKRDAGHRGAVEPCGSPVNKLDGPLGYYQKQLFYFIKRPLAIVHIVSYCF